MPVLTDNTDLAATLESASHSDRVGRQHSLFAQDKTGLLRHRKLLSADFSPPYCLLLTRGFVLSLSVND